MNNKSMMVIYFKYIVSISWIYVIGHAENKVGPDRLRLSSMQFKGKLFESESG